MSNLSSLSFSSRRLPTHNNYSAHVHSVERGRPGFRGKATCGTITFSLISLTASSLIANRLEEHESFLVKQLRQENAPLGYQQILQYFAFVSRTCYLEPLAPFLCHAAITD
jgi:hypothetical protein